MLTKLTQLMPFNTTPASSDATVRAAEWWMWRRVEGLRKRVGGCKRCRQHQMAPALVPDWGMRQ